MKLAPQRRGGKVGRVLAPALEQAGHELVDLDAAEAMVDFTDARRSRGRTWRAALERGVPCVIGTIELRPAPASTRSRGSAGLACFHAPNFALGAVLMMRFAEEAARTCRVPRSSSCTTRRRRTPRPGRPRRRRDLIGGDPAIHSVRLPGLVAHQEVLFGGDGQLLTIRHDTFSREAFVPGVLLALERLGALPPGLTVGLDALL